jgi:hypothetical protein
LRNQSNSLPLATCRYTRNSLEHEQPPAGVPFTAGLSTGPTTPEGMARTIAAMKAGRLRWLAQLKSEGKPIPPAGARRAAVTRRWKSASTPPTCANAIANIETWSALGVPIERRVVHSAVRSARTPAAGWRSTLGERHERKPG